MEQELQQLGSNLGRNHDVGKALEKMRREKMLSMGSRVQGVAKEAKEDEEGDEEDVQMAQDEEAQVGLSGG